MPFEPNNKLSKGRKTGSKNFKDNSIKDKLKTFYENNLEDMQSKYDQLDTNQQIKVMMDLTNYFVSKRKAVEITETSNEAQGVKMTIEEAKIINQALEEFY